MSACAYSLRPASGRFSGQCGATKSQFLAAARVSQNPNAREKDHLIGIDHLLGKPSDYSNMAHPSSTGTVLAMPRSDSTMVTRITDSVILRIFSGLFDLAVLALKGRRQFQQHA